MKETDKGFTITELMISTAFLGFLLVFVVTVVVQMMFIYNKGLTIRAINQSGRQIADDVSRSLRFADASQVKLLPNDRLCVGNAVYAWNIYDSLSNSYTTANQYTDGQPIRGVVRIDTSATLYCNTADIERTNSTALTGSQTDLLRMDVAMGVNGTALTNRLARIELTLSTVGVNRPLLDGVEYTCPTGFDGAFCAFGDFNSTVYVRN